MPIAGALTAKIEFSAELSVVLEALGNSISERIDASYIPFYGGAFINYRRQSLKSV